MIFFVRDFFSLIFLKDAQHSNFISLTRKRKNQDRFGLLQIILYIDTHVFGRIKLHKNIKKQYYF